MDFWARRPLYINLVGAILLLGGWIALGALGSWLAEVAGIPIWLRESLVLYMALLAATVLVTRLFDRMPLVWAGIGLHRWSMRELLLGAGLGAAMALIAWGPVALSGEVHRSTLNDFGYFLLLMSVSAAGEELLFRGYLFQRLVEILGPLVATLLTSVLFGLAHAANPNVTPLAVMIVILGGIFFALCYLRTGSLWLPIGAHITWNILLAKVLGVPVSGKEFGDSLFRTVAAGPELLTGGAFGPEGGIVGVIALLAGIGAVAGLSLFQYSPYVHAGVFRTFHARLKEKREQREGAT